MTYTSIYCGGQWENQTYRAFGSGSSETFGVYRLDTISLWCGLPYTFGRFVTYVYKNGIKIGECIWQDGAPYQNSFDGGKLCVGYWYLDCVYVYYELEVSWVLHCDGNYSDVYVNSTSGADDECGNSSTYPVKTFARAYAQLASGGTIHVLNSGADFSSETVTLNKSFSIDLNGSSGNWYGPKAS